MIIYEGTMKLLKRYSDWSFKQPRSLEKFIAKLYYYELTFFKKRKDEENLNTILLENAIWLHPKDDFSLLLDEIVLQEINELGLKTTFKDKATLQAISNSSRHHTMGYYLNRATQITEHFAAEIAEHARLKEIGSHYKATGVEFEQAFLGGKEAYLVPMLMEKPKVSTDCPYFGGCIKQAWLDGYDYGKIQDKYWSVLMRC